MRIALPVLIGLVPTEPIATGPAASTARVHFVVGARLHAAVAQDNHPLAPPQRFGALLCRLRVRSHAGLQFLLRLGLDPDLDGAGCKRA